VSFISEFLRNLEKIIFKMLIGFSLENQFKLNNFCHIGAKFMKQKTCTLGLLSDIKSMAKASFNSYHENFGGFLFRQNHQMARDG